MNCVCTCSSHLFHLVFACHHNFHRADSNRNNTQRLEISGEIIHQSQHRLRNLWTGVCTENKRVYVFHVKERQLPKLLSSLLKRRLLHQERICCPWEKILSFRVDSFYRRGSMCWKANRKSQKLPPLLKLVEIRNAMCLFAEIIIFSYSFTKSTYAGWGGGGGYTLKSAPRVTSNEYPQHMFCKEISKYLFWYLFYLRRFKPWNFAI